ncbi:tripartite tricarboxylate transporter permease [Archaeoglobus veneficus]|uniref:tripartite tricarboxylate transporter permease n=1 Tax=Archaeoglobus veneficus TaxID=58290 RepID=UPI00064E8259|nr:tripartite tricarboxylate transporter permease [Archaeoglobus veneficus]
MAASRVRERETYIAALSSANTANGLLCFAVLFATGKVRSGAANALSSLRISFSPELVVVCIAAALASTLLTLCCSFAAARFVEAVDFTKFSLAIFLFLTVLIYVLTGAFGLIVFSIASCVGLSALLLGVRRINCMGCLIVPVLFRYV